jgi:hypothetical protein
MQRVQEKVAQAHVEDACERRGYSAKAGEKFRDQKRPRASGGKKAFRFAHTGIRLERNFAQQLQNLDAFKAPHFIPNGVCAHRSENADGQTGEKIQMTSSRQRARR